MQPQPLIVVHDVPRTSRWYQAVLGLTSGHGGQEYERLMSGETLVLQLHAWDAHEHLNLGRAEVKPYGNGVVLWFLDDDIIGAFERAEAHKAEIIQPLTVNPNANHREFWLRDPNGYVVVVAGPSGDVG